MTYPLYDSLLSFHRQTKPGFFIRTKITVCDDFMMSNFRDHLTGLQGALIFGQTLFFLCLEEHFCVTLSSVNRSHPVRQTPRQKGQDKKAGSSPGGSSA